MSYYNPYNVSALTDRLKGDAVTQNSKQVNKVEKHAQYKQGQTYYGIGPGPYRTMPYPIYNDRRLTEFLKGDAIYQQKSAEIRNQLLVNLLTQNNERYSSMYWKDNEGNQPDDLPPTFMEVANERTNTLNGNEEIISTDHAKVPAPQPLAVTPPGGPEVIEVGGGSLRPSGKDGKFRLSKSNISFGLLILDQSKLNSNVFSAVRATTGKGISDLASRPLSSELTKAIKSIISNVQVPRNLDQLNFDEQMWLKKLTDKSKIGVHIPLPAKQLLEKLKVDLGSIQSGNNSALLKEETMKVIALMKKNNILSKQMSNEIRETFMNN